MPLVSAFYPLRTRESLEVKLEVKEKIVEMDFKTLAIAFLTENKIFVELR